MGVNKCWGSKKIHPPSKTRAPKNFRWCRWGAERRVKRAQTRERGPPSAPAEILKISTIKSILWKDNLFSWELNTTRAKKQRLIEFIITLFYHGPLVKRGRDQGMEILLLHLILQSSIGPIRAKHKTRCSSLIGQQYWRLKATGYRLKAESWRL